MPSDAPRWNAGTLFAFRFACVYTLLQWIPLTLQLVSAPLLSGLINPPNVWGARTFAVGEWVIAHLLSLPEHSPPRMSGNSLPQFLGIVTAIVVSLILAAAWSALDRRRGYPRLFVWVHTAQRFMLAAVMLSYGWEKILPSQFAIGFDYLVMPVADHNPRDLLWAFMGASREYQVFSGAVEVAGGLLLLTRRTALLGAFISMAAMANVVAIDISYDVPVKFLALQIFLLTLAVLAPYIPRLTAAMTSTGAISARPVHHLLRNPLADQYARGIGLVVAAWIAFSTFHYSQTGLAARTNNANSPLHGIWDVEETHRDGVRVPLEWADAGLWRRLVVPSSNSAIIFPMSDSAPQQASGRSTAIRYSARLDHAARTIELTPFPFFGAAKPRRFTYASSDPNLLVLTGQDDDGRAILVSLRRFDPAVYPLVSWRRSWRW